MTDYSDLSNYERHAIIILNSFKNDDINFCTLCYTSKTPMWRKISCDGKISITCNACGIRHTRQKMKK